MAAKSVPVYGTERMTSFLKRNGPWSLLVDNKYIELRTMTPDQAIELAGGLRVTPMLVPHRDGRQPVGDSELAHGALGGGAGAPDRSAGAGRYQPDGKLGGDGSAHIHPRGAQVTLWLGAGHGESTQEDRRNFSFPPHCLGDCHGVGIGAECTERRIRRAEFYELDAGLTCQEGFSEAFGSQCAHRRIGRVRGEGD